MSSSLPENNPQKFRVRPLSAGSQWFVDAGKLMNGQFVRWLSLMLVFLAVFIISNLIQGVMILYAALSPVFWAGIFLAGSAASNKLEWTPSILLEPLKRHHKSLLLLGVILMVLNLLMALWLSSSLAEIIDFENLNKIMLEVANTGDKEPLIKLFSDPQLVEQILMKVLLAMLIFLPITMAGWFAPALIFEHNLKPLAALTLSFKACSANFLPFLSYGLIGMVLIIVTMAFFIFAILVLPLLLATYYTSYRDIWPEVTSDTPPSEEQQTSIII